MNRKFYLTTAIDYSNGDPHLGHALEKVGADCIARYRRARGDQVHFVMGMDEHGQKVAMAAEQAGLAAEQWVARISERFESTWRALHCSHDDWIRTTEPRHHAAVAEFLYRITEPVLAPIRRLMPNLGGLDISPIILILIIILVQKLIAYNLMPYVV